jgi:hypothetical protein
LSTFAQLPHVVPDELAEEVLKRPLYVSEGIRNPRLLPRGTRVAFELRPGFETGNGPAHSGCLAFRRERLAWAFLAQHGVDSKTWPEALQRGGSV